MKYTFLWIMALGSSVQAFPYLMGRDPIVPYVSTETRLQARGDSLAEGNCGPVPCTTFDERDQFVDVRPGSTHEYIAPRSEDIRGPCPGLNAAANHGFIPRDGIVSIAQAILGLFQAYGMGPDLSGFLAAYAVFLSGDVLGQTWSIGGPYYRGGGLLSLFGEETQGISYSHNKYEGDASACRSDAYINNGDAHSLVLSKFEHLYNLGERYTLDLLRGQNLYNQQISVSTNPYYFSAPFSGLIVAPAAHNFIVNFMSNHSADQPNGYLDKAQLKTFFGISGPDNQLVWNRGQERIPNHWYRRPSSNPYTGAAAITDVLIGLKMYPQTLKVGGNNGSVNSFNGVDIGRLTNGTYNSKNLLEGNNLGCFAIQSIHANLHESSGNPYRDITEALGLLSEYTTPLLKALGCPNLPVYNHGLFNRYPGYKYNPTGPETNYKK